MLHRLTPITGRLAGRWQRRNGQPSGFAGTATRTWTVSPAVDRVMQPAIFDEGDLEKIVGVAPDGNTIAGQIMRARGGLEHHVATLAFELDDVVLSHGHLYTHRMAHALAGSRMPWLAARAAREIDQAVLATTPYGIKYFGHWMVDDLPLTLAAQTIGAPVSTLADHTPHQTQYLDLLEFNSPVVSSARFKKLVVLQDHGQNDYKQERYARLRDLAGVKVAAARRPGVMLLRGNSGVRRMLVNESEVAESVTKRGFLVVDSREHTAKELVSFCLEADVVIGVEGSHLAHGVLWMPPRGTLVVLQPPDRFNCVHKDYCDCIGIRFAFIVGDPREGGDFWIDVPRLERLLDRLG